MTFDAMVREMICRRARAEIEQRILNGTRAHSLARNSSVSAKAWFEHLQAQHRINALMHGITGVA